MIRLTRAIDGRVFELCDQTTALGAPLLLRLGKEAVGLSVTEAEEIRDALTQFLEERGRG
jgi:hypothetical protein